MTTLEIILARFACAPVVGPQAQHMMRLSLMDWAACAVAARDEPVTAILRARALEDGGRAEATLIGGGRVPARAAALVNGTSSHALDYDDTHFAHIGHPSVAVIPAALAIAERSGANTGASMDAMIDAALIGVEASVRVGLWLGRDHYETGFHQTATAGAFGATLAAGRLLGLTEGQMIAALGLAATRASGLKSQFGTMGKPYNAGLAAETGVEAALLAQAGMTAAPFGLSGHLGFGPTHHGADDMTGFAGLGSLWMFERISHKFHACCHGLHAMLEAVGALHPDPAQVAAVRVQTNPRWMTVCNQQSPNTGLGAKFSYRVTCAMALAGVDTGAIVAFSDAMTGRADIVALRDRVAVVADTAVGEMQSVVTITLRDGTTHTARHDLDAPLTLADRTTKLRRKATGLVGENTADRMQRAAFGDSLSDMVAVLG